jgi:hypothetical protein
MKKLLFITCMFISVLVFAQESVNTELGVYDFDTEIIDYGTIEKNAKKNRFFKFKNTGKSPILITSVRATCGCTVAKKPSKPILPNETGTIEVNYDTNRIGAFSKTITVSSNASEKSKILRIKGTVLNSENSKLVSK